MKPIRTKGSSKDGTTSCLHFITAALWLLAAIATTTLCFLVAPQAQARDLIDTGAECSITFKHNAKAAASGAGINLTLAANVFQTGDLTLADTFKVYEGEVSLDSSDWPGTAQVLASLAARDSLEPCSSSTFNYSGEATFSFLKPGLYLVTIEHFRDESEHYTTEPYLIHLPILDEKTETWLYAGVSNVKYETEVVANKKTTITAVKTWKNCSSRNHPEQVTVQLLKDGKPYREAVLSKANNWRFAWRGLNSKSSWSVIEKNTPQGYEQSISRQGRTYTITNTYQGEGNKEERLPQTGMLLWPIPVLFAAGLALVLIGLIYRSRDNCAYSRSAVSRAERRSQVEKPERVPIVFGILCLVAALALLLGAVFSSACADKAVNNSLISYEAQAEASGLSTTSPDANREMATISADGREYIGLLEIPSLELKLPIQSSWGYPELRSTPCRYTGSAYNDTLVVAAHNYLAHFGRINELRIGDAVRFTDVEGTRIDYRVVAVDILSPADITGMTECPACDLTLFTCTLGGANRVTVRCKRI